ncbi:MAG: hypothetical protein KBI47_08900 [Armatimonadetes bacterium]|nr:hypothetical protein [Armatimonadota bacterium]MDI9582742.1 hypothetical protein [Acidobacteriota bacterium]
MSDLGDRIRRDENAFQRLMQDIPGFDGYREREIRRTADKLLREQLVAEMDVVRGAINAVMRRDAREGRLQGLNDLDRLARHMGKVRDNVRFADYGYTGFFDAVKIDEDDLDRIYQHDVSLRDQIEYCALAVEALSKAPGDEVQAAVDKTEQAIAKLQEMVDGREQVAASAVPGRDS